jgi:hypothetical protein
MNLNNSYEFPNHIIVDFLSLSYERMNFYLPQENYQLYNNNYLINKENIYLNSFFLNFLFYDYLPPFISNSLIAGLGIGYIFGANSRDHFLGNIPIIVNDGMLNVPSFYYFSYDINSFVFKSFGGIKVYDNLGISLAFNLIKFEVNKLKYSLNVSKENLVNDENLTINGDEVIMNRITCNYPVIICSLGIFYDLNLGCSIYENTTKEDIVNLKDAEHKITFSLNYSFSVAQNESSRDKYLNGISFYLDYNLPLFCRLVEHGTLD